MASDPLPLSRRERREEREGNAGAWGGGLCNSSHVWEGSPGLE